jgi:hypothetical protein
MGGQSNVSGFEQEEAEATESLSEIGAVGKLTWMHRIDRMGI